VKFVSTEQVFDALVNAAVIEYGMRNSVVRLATGRLGTRSAQHGLCPRGARVRMVYGFAHGVQGWSLPSPPGGAK
jgi:hypothetical protein